MLTSPRAAGLPGSIQSASIKFPAQAQQPRTLASPEMTVLMTTHAVGLPLGYN